MKKIFLTLTLIAALAPRPAQAMDSKSLLNIGVTTAVGFTPSIIAAYNMFPFNKTTKKYQTWLLAGACGIGSGLLTKAIGNYTLDSCLAGIFSVFASSIAAKIYGHENLMNAIRNNNESQLLNTLSKPGVFYDENNSTLLDLTYLLSTPNIESSTIKVLIKNSLNSNYSSLLMTALEHHRDPEVIQLIVDKGAYINPQNYNDGTPLMQAIISAPHVEPEIFRQQLDILLKAGANPRIQNNAGQNAFDLANNLPGEHATIFTQMTHSKSEIEKLLPFLRAFEIQE